MSNIVNAFGAMRINPDTNEKITSILDLLASSDNLPNNAVTRNIDFSNGNVTENQWTVSDFMTSDIRKFTLVEIAEEMKKPNYNSVQKMRDGFVKNVVEALITVAFVLEEPNNILDLVIKTLNR